MKSKKGGSDYDCDFKLADLGLSHFKEHVPSQGDATDRDSFGTRAYGRLHSDKLPDFTMADGSSGAPDCYRADSDIEKISLLVKQSVDIWSLGCTLSEAAVWIVHGKNGLSEYGRRRGIETGQIRKFRDGNFFHDGEKVLGIVTDTHKNLPHDIRPRDHITGAIVEIVTRQMLIEANGRTPAKPLSYQTKRILDDAEIKLKASRPYTGTGSVSGTIAESPPRTPPEPPPGHVQPRATKCRRQHTPSHFYTGSPASTSYDEEEAHHQEPVDGFFGNRAFQQANYNDWPTRRQNRLINPSHTEYEDHDQVPKNHFEVDQSQDSPSSPPWQDSLSEHRKQRQTPSDLFSSANTRNGLHPFARDRQETYNSNQRNSFGDPQEGVSRASTATLVPDLYNGSRARQHRPNISSTQHSRLVTNGSSNVLPPLETQPSRRHHPPPFLSVTDAQQWKSDKKRNRPVTLPNGHYLADLNKRDHVSQRCIHCY